MGISEILKKSFLFSSFNDSDLKGLERFVKIMNFVKDEHVFSESEQANSLYIVASGEVKVYKVSVKGQEQILHIQREGDLVAEAAMFGIETYPANCVTTSACRLLEINVKKFKEYLFKNPQVSLKLLKSYSLRLREFVNLIHSLSLQDVKGRLAQHILNNAKKKGKELVYEDMITKKELASLLGTIPESISRTLHFLKSTGCITEQDRKIIINDAEALKEYVS